MFDNNYTNIELYDGEIFFLAVELGLSRLIGLEIDYPSMNAETKNAFKQESYQLLNEHAAVKMDFSGKTAVNDRFAEIVRAFENPDYCAVIQVSNNSEKTSEMRKIYLNGGKYTALDYVEENLSQIYEFEEKNDARAFLKGGISFKASDAQVPDSGAAVEDLLSSCYEFFVLFEYKKTVNGYDHYESLCFKQDNAWFRIVNNTDDYSIVKTEGDVFLTGDNNG